MPVAAASDALVRHLRARPEEAGALEGLTVEATTLPEARTKPGHGVTLVLWRVQPNSGGLKLRYLLVMRGSDSHAEQTMLGRCMAVLDRYRALAEEAGAPGSIAADALVVIIETPQDGAHLRLAEACGDPPLVVPYVAPSVRRRPPEAGRIRDPPGTEIP